MKKYIKIVLAVIILIFLLMLPGIIKPTVSYENEVHINKPVDISFMVFTDPSKMEEWLTGFKKMEWIQGMPAMPGSLMRLTLEINGREVEITEEVLAFEWNRRFAFRLHHKKIKVDCDYTFVASDMNSKIKSSMMVQGKNVFWRTINVFMKGKMQKQNQEDLEKLKAVIEAS
jgi:hypothetical protein